MTRMTRMTRNNKKNNDTMKICIFCSANDNIDAEYFRRTEELGQGSAQNGHMIVFGGCDMGLMETCIVYMTIVLNLISSFCW